METSTCSGNTKLYFSCSGGSSVGQLANDVCRELTREGAGKLFCLAGIGGRISGIVEAAKASNSVVAVDGCGVKCALKALEAADVPIHHYVVLTDWGIEKNGNLFPEASVIQDTKQKITALIGDK